MPATPKREIKAAGRVVKVRKIDGPGPGLSQGLIWFEVYLPFRPDDWRAFQDLAVELGGDGAPDYVAAAEQDPDLARLACDPIDAHKEAMLAPDVAALARAFLVESRAIDVMHDEEARDSVQVVESFINGPEVDSPHYFPGAWVIVLRVQEGSAEWALIEAGALREVSFQASVVKIPAVVLPAQEQAA